MSTPLAMNRYAIVLVVASACVGVNPDWESPGGPTNDDSGGTTDPGDHEATTTDAQPGGSVTLLNDASSGGDANACLEQGLASCESDGMHVCAELEDDVAHCGTCFHDCRAFGADRCEKGVCECEGGKWGKLCDGRCADTKNDPSACGPGCIDCGALFGPDVRCREGMCEDDDDDRDDDRDDH